MSFAVRALLRRSGAPQQCFNAVNCRGMATSLFVGGLSWTTDDRTLQEAFSSFGEIREAKVITDRDTGRSRGFGFVNFFNDSDAEAALKEMEGKVLGGRAIRVSYATGGRGGRGDGFGSGGEMGGQDRGFGNDNPSQNW